MGLSTPPLDIPRKGCYHKGEGEHRCRRSYPGKFRLCNRNRHRPGWRFLPFIRIVTVYPKICNVMVIGILSPPSKKGSGLTADRQFHSAPNAIVAGSPRPVNAAGCFCQPELSGAQGFASASLSHVIGRPACRVRSFLSVRKGFRNRKCVPRSLAGCARKVRS